MAEVTVREKPRKSRKKRRKKNNNYNNSININSINTKNVYTIGGEQAAAKGKRGVWPTERGKEKEKILPPNESPRKLKRKPN